jgi:hypothetical protein
VSGQVHAVVQYAQEVSPQRRRVHVLDVLTTVERSHPGGRRLAQRPETLRVVGQDRLGSVPAVPTR